MPTNEGEQLRLLSVVIPARNEEDCVGPTVEQVAAELEREGIPHEIVVVDDGSTDQTWSLLVALQSRLPCLRPIQNVGERGFGRTVVCGLNHMEGDAVVITMADGSDDCRDIVRYWRALQEGCECVFGSRFMKGGQVVDYPILKLFLNRLANLFLRLLFRVKLNDTTNAFKAYRRLVIDGCRPLIAPHFNITIELPLKAIVRGYSWTVIPVSWRNRSSGASNFRIKEMGSRYFFISLYVWLEKYFSRGDYKRR